MAAPGSLAGPAKLGAVSNLLGKLTKDLEQNNLSSQERDSALEELKIYGRDPRHSDPIFAKEGVETLTKHAFKEPSTTTSRNALRVLCNAMLLKPETRQRFVDLGYEAQACEVLKSDNRDDEFLISRLLLFTTYGTTIDLQKLVDEHQLAGSIIENIARHAERISTKPSSPSAADPMEEMALIESLKLLFNITSMCKTIDSSPAVTPLVTLLSKLDVTSQMAPLSPPLSPLVNALMNVNLDSEVAKPSLYPENITGSITEKLVHLLDLSMKTYSDNDLEITVSPLVCLIARIHEHAPAEARKFLQSKLLPTQEDRKAVLGQGDNLPARLLKNWTNALAPQLRTAIAELFFDLSDKDANKFVQNVGYGFASGFLFQRNIPVPDSARDGATMGDVPGSGGRPINPITGQFLDAEGVSELPEMTDEEKEREAERLFVLFERLNQLGVIQVQNPIQQAVQSGRFEELPDDAEDVD
ncbi:guanine nucleotide exchange factor [Podospora aff. communis PSN243]|uniref:Guanine nucleotide exchange factor n=1 Tax=Podospora aff. communis PSN243 TaxID=3040156 RepID=A0AAV9GVH2_9PEZI|nr:guanine nucleotide exchange factor [Podospora aff. communis PSN243]